MAHSRRRILVAGGAGLAGLALGRVPPAGADGAGRLGNGTERHFRELLDARVGVELPVSLGIRPQRHRQDVRERLRPQPRLPGEFRGAGHQGHAHQLGRGQQLGGPAPADPLPLRRRPRATARRRQRHVPQLGGARRVPGAVGAGHLAGVLADRRKQLAAGERHPGVQGRRAELVQHLPQRRTVAGPTRSSASTTPARGTATARGSRRSTRPTWTSTTTSTATGSASTAAPTS